MEDFIGLVHSNELDHPLVITISQAKNSLEANDKLSSYCVERNIFPEQTIVFPAEGVPKI